MAEATKTAPLLAAVFKKDSQRTSIQSNQSGRIVKITSNFYTFPVTVVPLTADNIDELIGQDNVKSTNYTVK